MKKIIANSLFAIRTLIVVLCVVCGAAPAWADAEVELKNASGTKVTEGTWSEMIVLAKKQDGYTLVLQNDVVLPKGNDCVVGTNLTVDLNGHVLSATTFDNTFNFALCINKAGKTLTIKDSQGGGKIKSEGSNGTMYGIELYSGSVVLDRVAIEVKNTHASGNSAGVHVRNTGTGLTIIGGSIQSTSEGTGYACGVYVEGSQTISITGTEVSASAKQNAHAVHTAGGELLINDGTFTTTTSGNYAYSVYSNGTTTINGGTFTAGSGGSYAYGLYSTAGKITATGATISASAVTSKAYAAMAKGSVTDGGVESVGELVLNNCTLTATSKTDVYGVLCNGAARDATAQDTSPRAVCGKATVNGGSISATATASSTALAIYMEKTYISPDGQKKSDAELIVRNATLRAEAKSTAYCIYAGSKTTVDGCNITAISEGETAYGVALYDGASTVTNSAITTEAGTTVACGIFASGATMSNGVPREAVVTIDNNSVQATAGTKFGYALYAQGTSGGSMVVAGKIIVNGGTYNGQAPADGETSHEGYAACCKGSVLYEGEVAYPSIVINGGRFNGSSADVSPSGEPGHFVLNGGYYVKDLNLDKKLGEGMNKVAVKSGTPEYAAGYRFRVTDDMTGETVCKVYQGTTLKGSFSSLEEALAYVNLPANSSATMTIVLCGNYTLSKGDYVLPGNKTLLVPYKTGTGKGATQAAGTDPQIINHNTEYTPPTPLYKLTFASGVNMTVRSGAVVEASSVLYITNGSGGSSLLKEGTGIVHDKYGWIELEQGAHIDLESGAKLYAWGYITGKGEINAKSGSEVYEDFQMGDWRGGTLAESVQDNKNGLAGKGVFLITHYYYQNIECPITYRAGAKAYAKGGVSGDWLWSTINAVTNPAVQFVGTDENSMFQMDPATAGVDTWVRKEYDPETDYVNWFMNSGAELGGLTLQMSSSLIDIDVKASDYVLPITSNFNIIANYGDMTIVSDVCFIPGSKLTIKKEADVTIPEGVRAYFYDQDDWSSYKGYWFCPGYSPSWQTNPRLVNIGSNTTEKMPDAEVLVEGTLNIEGAAYTTAGGANIHSTRENAGKVMFQANAPSSTAALGEFTSSTGGRNRTLCQWVRSESSTVYYEGKALASIKLKNEDNTYTPTTGTTAGQNWIYMEDGGEYRWVLSYDDGCFNIKGDKHYIHPSDWVAVEANASGDHAYHSEDGTRMFINAQGPANEIGCVWWEVNPTPDEIDETTYYVANNDYFDNYGTYFYWEDSEGYWMPKKVTITWKDKDGNKITNGTFGDVYNFNTSPQFYGTDPTWPNTTTEKHEWIGWRDEAGNIYDKNATLPRATSNVTYTAYFVTTKYQSTITFKNDDNTIIWAGLVDHGTVPVCPVEPTKTSTASTDYTFTGWNTEPVAVTGTATYIAQYSTSTRQYTVTFYNYDAVTELYSVKVDYNARPSYDGITPFRVNTSAYSYAWTGWQQGDTHYDTSAALAQVTGDVSYIATFAQTELQYQVFFKRPDGSIIDAGFYAYNETPAAFPANPTMASTVSTDYSFTGWSPATLVPVTEDGMTYTAQFSESVRRYTAHFVNYDGSLLADVVVDYNNVPAYAGETPFKPNDKRNSFEFSGWSWDGGSAGSSDPLPAMTGDITFTAQFTPVLLQFNVFYRNEDGSLIEWQKKKYGETTIAPTIGDYQDEQYNYTFTGWTPATIGNPVTADATYTAHFDRTVRTYTVTFDIQGHGAAPEEQVVAYNALLTPPANPTEAGYIFGGWYQEPACTNAWNFATDRVTSATTLYAKWTAVVASVTIGSTTTEYTRFDEAWTAVNAATAASTLTLLQDVTVTTKLTYNNSNNKDCILDLNGHILTSNTSEISPLHINNANVTFTVTDGTEGKSGKLSLNTSSSSTIFGVYVQYGAFRLEGGTIEVTSSTATACGVTIHYGTFTMNGGTIHVKTTNGKEGRGIYANSTTTVNGGTVHVEAAGTAYGVRHDGGIMTINDGKFSISGSTASYMNYTDAADNKLIIKGGYYNIDTRLGTYVSAPYHVFDLSESDLPYKYKVAEGYTVTFNANGHGSAPESQLIEKNTHATTPTAPTAEGYTFGGWYKEAACTNEWDFVSDVVTQATTLFAKWTAINYSISYDLAGGSVTSANPTSYTVESSVITLNNPTKEGYTFLGWTGSNGSTPQTAVSISAGSTGDKNYIANWAVNVASVTVNSTTTYYTSFDAAWTDAGEASADATLTLLDEVSGLASSRTYSASHDLTLDLNGHTISGSGSMTSLFQINSAGHTFTVTDGSANHDGKLSFSSGSGSTSHCVIVTNGTFVLEAGMMEATSSTASIGAVQVTGGTFTMNENGAVHAKYTGNVNGNNSRLVHAKSGTTTINGGSIRLESTKDAIGVVYSSGNVTFNGGLFYISASGTAAVTNKDAQNSNLNIRGGYYSATESTYFNPHVKSPYHIFSNSDATYIYRVAAAYTLTWTTDGDALTGNYTSGLTEPGTTIVAPNTPTKTGYTFYGWTPAVAATMPSADTEYTATWAVASVTIGGTTTLYTTFEPAWTAANTATAAATLTLLQDVTVTAQLAYTNSNNQNCTLDLNGHTLTSETDSQQPLHINRSGISFTITDGTVDKSGKLSLNTSFSSSAIFGAFVDNGTLLLNGGTIEVTSSTAATCGVTANSNGTFTMNGGTIYVKTTANNKEGRGVYSVGRVIINDGAIHVEAAGTAYGIKRDGGTVTVNNGKFNVTGSPAYVTNQASTNANVVIKGGYYNIDTNLETCVASPYHVFPNDDAIYRYKVAEGYSLTWDLDGGEVSVAGTPAGYVAVGDPITAPTVSKTDYTFTGWSTEVAQTMPANDVTYTATWEYNGVACVTINGTTTYYMTIAAAFNAANASTTYEPTITLLQDAVTTTTSMLSYTGAKNCTLNLNGHTLSSTTAQALLYINKAGITFTITDLTESKSGTLHLESTSTDNRWCVYVAQGNLMMDAGIVFLRSKANTYNEGIRIDPATSTFTMNGGKVHVETSDGKPARGIVSRGIAVINDGEIQVEASGIGYGIEARVSDDGNNIGNVTVNGGKFLVTGTTAACAYRSDARATLKLQGGYYNEAIASSLATYTSAPYEVQETTAADKEAVGSEYNYKVVKNDETGFYIDIVDWTASNLTINANGWTASGWPYTINDVEYYKDEATATAAGSSNYRAADRTLTIPYSGEAGADLVIKLQDKDENIISQHSYKIPFIGTTAGAGTEDTVYVNSGTLTISTNTTLGGLYVRPEASVDITDGTLTVGKLVLRTLPWQAAAISGSFTATETWYTRIAPNKRTISGPYAPITYESASYYQFALPRNCTVALKDIKVSNGANTPYGTTWLLKRYDESIRAEDGAGADNWVALNGNETIQGGIGYELFSNSNYYREFYFPLGAVNSASLGTTTAVTYHSGAAGEKHAGWNIVASPLMSVYDNRGADPETGLKVSWLLTDGSYDQGVPEYIYPAIPFSYQASEGQTVISFEGSSIVAAAPRRSMEEESVRKQWLHLDIKNANGVGDQTSILTHPTRYEQTYKTGIDVAKQSFTASRPLLYSSHTYGEMAFAGVADSLIEQGIPLTLYSPIPQELTISLRDNNWLDRLAEVWLIDNQTGAQIDLIDSDYTFEANEGTTRGRLLLMGRFKAPNIATDIENTEATEGNSVKAQKLIIRDKLYIRINGQLYDATGKMVNDK